MRKQTISAAALAVAACLTGELTPATPRPRTMKKKSRRRRARSSYRSRLASARLSAGAIYRLAPRWRLLTSYSYARLTGDAGSSPITESRNQHFLAASAVYLLR
jgi:MltA-interacting protein MipA